MKYVYMVLSATHLINGEQLNEPGEEGWQLTGIIRGNDNYIFYFIKQVAADVETRMSA